MNFKKSIFFVLALLFAGNVFCQEALKSLEEDYYDFLSRTGITVRPTLGYRTLSDNVWEYSENLSDEITDEIVSHPWKDLNLGKTFTLWQYQNEDSNWFTKGIPESLKVKIYGPEWFNSYNTAAPYGQNDGALWQGRGYNTAFTTGIRLEGYGFELTFKPQISWMENREFDTNSDIYPSPYSYSFKSGKVNQKIDIVQRYGDSSFFNYDWGDSEIRWTWRTLTFGVGTQNPWLGPAYLNPMLGSNNTAGYLKFDAGLRKTKVIIPFVEWSLGYIEGRIWIGQLEESDYFDADDNNNTRMLTAMSASYEPSFIPGLTIGLNRIFLTYWRAENLKYILRLFTTSRSNALASSGNDEDQKFSLFAEWNFPKVGFTAYGEFGRDDFSSDEESNPFHTAIYTIGAKQNIPLPFGLESELNFEWNDFEMSQDFQLQWPYFGYYGHGFVKQGYTNKGQVLGAGSGWAGNSQFVQYKVYYPKGYTAIKFHRYCPNNNSVYSQAVNDSAENGKSDLNTNWYANFETYFVYGIESDYYITPQFSVNGKFNYIHIIHHQYNASENLDNFNLQLLLKYCL